MIKSTKTNKDHNVEIDGTKFSSFSAYDKRIRGGPLRLLLLYISLADETNTTWLSMLNVVKFLGISFPTLEEWHDQLIQAGYLRKLSSQMEIEGIRLAMDMEDEPYLVPYYWIELSKDFAKAIRIART